MTASLLFDDAVAPAALRLDEAHRQSTGAGVRVAVLDTGVDRRHPALAGTLLPGFSANDFSFYEELNAVVQNEPADWVDADTVGLYAAIGIRKGQPFAPDARMKKTLTEAVAVGNAYARANAWASRDPRTRFSRTGNGSRHSWGAAISFSRERSDC